MLNVTKSINLNGESKIGGNTVAYLSANVTKEGNTTTSKNITNQDLYQTNNVEVRKDISDFENQVYALEDELATETAATTTPTV